MRNVIAMTATLPEPPLHRRIRRYSRALTLLLGGLAMLYIAFAGAVLLAMLAYRGTALQIGSSDFVIALNGAPPAPGYVTFGALPFGQRLAYVLVGLLRVTPGAAILIELRRLFGLYAGGTVFARANADRIRTIGLWLAADAVAPLACHLFLASTGFEIDRNWLHLQSFEELVLGALVCVIALVMRVGDEIEQDRSGFV